MVFKAIGSFWIWRSFCHFSDAMSPYISEISDNSSVSLSLSPSIKSMSSGFVNHWQMSKFYINFHFTNPINLWDFCTCMPFISDNRASDKVPSHYQWIFFHFRYSNELQIASYFEVRTLSSLGQLGKKLDSYATKKETISAETEAAALVHINSRQFFLTFPLTLHVVSVSHSL